MAHRTCRKSLVYLEVRTRLETSRALYRKDRSILLSFCRAFVRCSYAPALVLSSGTCRAVYIDQRASVPNLLHTRAGFRAKV